LSSGLNAAVTFGLVEASVDGDVSMDALLELAFCTTCDGTYADGFSRVDTSSFYVHKTVGFGLSGESELLFEEYVQLFFCPCLTLSSNHSFYSHTFG
jgi:hypothetical protein